MFRYILRITDTIIKNLLRPVFQAQLPVLLATVLKRILCIAQSKGIESAEE